MKKFLLTIISLFLSFSLPAEVIREIQVSGNTKTQDWALLRRVNVAVGDELSPQDLDDLRVRLSQNAQYILKSVTFNEGVLKIAIEDKWSLIPVPLLSQSGEYYMRGVGFYENNFLGRLETFIPAVAWTNSGINYLVLYNSENFFSPNLGISSLIVKLNTLSRFYRRNVELSYFESRTSAFEVTPNFFYKNMVFKSGPIFFKKDVYFNGSKKAEVFEGAGLRSRFNIKLFEQLETLYKGFYLTANAYVLKPKNYEGAYFHGKIEVNSSYPIFENHFINLAQFLGIASRKNLFYQFSEGSHEGFRGYDGESLHMQRYSATMIQYQHHLWDRLYVLAFLENTHSVLVNSIYNGAHLNENTLGTGLRYYLKKVTIPGINLEYGYNIQDRSSHIHFNVGLKL